MVSRLLAAFAVLAPVAGRAAGDPAEEAARALVQLRSHRNYAWETTVTPSPFVTTESFAPAFPDRDSPVTLPATNPVLQLISGTTQQDGTTVMSAPVGPRAGIHDYSIRAVWHDGRAAAETHLGWLTPAQLKTSWGGAIDAKPGPQVMLPHGATVSALTYFSKGLMLVALLPPHQEIAATLARANPPVVADRHLVATLHPEMARQLLLELHVPPAELLGEAEGSISLWLAGGEIRNYEIALEGDLRPLAGASANAHVRHVRLVKTTEIKKFDIKDAVVPAEALRRLEVE
jgi:hypothetical protein